MKAKDPLWRLANLYQIKDAESGRVIPFRPRPEQELIFRAVYGRKLRRIIVLKARRLGMSTGIDVMAIDMALCNAGVQISIVDQTQDDATKKLNTICKVALDAIPKEGRPEIIRSNDSALEISADGDTASAIYAGKNARGGTNQLLHLSEWGVIQADDPRRSEEILTGAIPSAEHGVVIVETTWKGGKGGLLWDLVKEAMEKPDEEKTPDDWHLFFFPWWTDPTYVADGGEIEQETQTYLNELEKRIGRRLTDRQRNWYARRRKELGVFIFREFPSTLDECFRAPIEGAIYADLLDRLRVQGAIRPSAVDGSALIHTFWDLGSPMNTVTWYLQLVGSEVRVIDCDMGLDFTPVQRAAHMMSKGYNYGYHYLPHDAAATERSGRTFAGELQGAGIGNIRIVPKTVDIWIGINRLRQLMPRMVFRIPACEEGIGALENYHTRRITTSTLISDEPVHDWSSHQADALRVFAEAEAAGMLTGDNSTAKKAKHRHANVLMGFRGNDGAKPRRLIDSL